MVVSIILSVLVFVHLFFLTAVLKKDFSLIDIGWGLGFVLISFVTYFHHPLSVRNALTLLVVTLWGMRLALYIFKRGRGKGEDPRYTKLRNEWGNSANLQAYLKVFLMQGTLMLIISLPITSGMTNKVNELHFLNKLGLIVFTFGFVFEVYSDWYLNRFKSLSENKGKLCFTGPWSLCRFPNYFGEITLWYGIYLLNVNLNNAWSILGPITIHFFIIKVTGVAPLERKYFLREEYQEYARRMPRMIPWTKP